MYKRFHKDTKYIQIYYIKLLKRLHNRCDNITIVQIIRA